MREERLGFRNESEGRFRAVFDAALDAMLIASDEGGTIEANPAACALLGRTRDELLKTADAEAWAAFIREGQAEGHLQILRPDGTTRDVEYTATAGFLPELHLVVLRDITERKAGENELRAKTEQLEALSRRLVNLQEEERRMIARELHDEVGQILTGLKLTLETSERPGAVVDLRRAQELTDQLAERLRDLSLNLRPPMLDDLGLVPTLLWHFERYSEQTGIQVRFHHHGIDAKLPAGTEVAAFRIAQEALTNVARHAGVREATVELWVEERSLCLRVEDEGRGFGPTAEPGPTSGLTGMRERAQLVGGSLTIESEPGAGTRLMAQLPLP